MVVFGGGLLWVEMDGWMLFGDVFGLFVGMFWGVIMVVVCGIWLFEVLLSLMLFY